MSMQFLAFHQGSGFADRWPVEVMTKEFSKLVKENPDSTIHDAPGTVALWWDRANGPGTLTLETAEGATKRPIKGNQVVWLKNKTTVTAEGADGKKWTAKVLANGETKIVPPKPQPAARRRRAP